ncbi:hypothetical protein [Xanthomonas sp. GW]|uniref:hypothetical protein n=1 Tax=Xanthomonas sp. GW TaxID=2724121 RepID=UPI00163B3B7A|nr:hypothetical protein [Xanthomonas sp. GW]
MKIMSTVRRFRYLTKGVALCVVASIALAVCGCSVNSHSVEGAKCNSNHFDVLRAIADNSEIRGYAKEHFSSREITFLWDGMSSKVEACGVVNGGMKIVRSSSPGFNHQDEFIAIEKMYFDDDAAFVEVGFPPTGKNGDVFLRKRAGKWVVVEKLLWES